MACQPATPIHLTFPYMVCDVSLPRLYTDQSEQPYTKYSIFGHTPKNSNSSHIGMPHLKHVSSRATFKHFTSTQHHLQATRLHGGITSRIVLLCNLYQSAIFYLQICTAAQCATVHIRKYKMAVVFIQSILIISTTLRRQYGGPYH